MSDVAGWVALAATCIAAVMTASNLGARVTGWGFVVFTVGAIAWIIVAITAHETQLLYSNVFLGVVDLLGVWRWLGQRARLSDTSRAEEAHSDARAGEHLFSTSKLDGLPVKSRDGDVLATAVDGMAACRGGRIDFLIVRAGGIGGVGEKLYRLPWAEARVGDDEIKTDLTADAFARLPFAVQA